MVKKHYKKKKTMHRRHLPKSIVCRKGKPKVGKKLMRDFIKVRFAGHPYFCRIRRRVHLRRAERPSVFAEAWHTFTGS